MKSRAMLLACLLLSVSIVAGCSGPSVRSNALPSEQTAPLVETGDSRIAIALDAVVVRNAPGSWAKDAVWDEYRFRISSTSGDKLRVTRITVVDALDQPVEPHASRSRLIDGTRDVAQRYEASGKLARSPSDGTWMFVGGVAATSAAAGMLTAAAMPTTGFLAGSAASIAGMAVATYVAAGALAGAGVIKLVNNTQVQSEIERRHTPVPAAIGGSASTVVVFFPIVPLPSAVEISYVDGAAENLVRLPLTAVLAETHAPSTAQLVFRPEPKSKRLDELLVFEEGNVMAKLTIDADGNVSTVEVIEAQSPWLVAEAKLLFHRYRYTAGAEGRTAEETIEFKRRGSR
jgi:hypothetical protein